MKPKVFKEADGCWVSSCPGSYPWSSHVPNVVYVKRHETWEEALYYANARAEFSKHRHMYFGGSQ